MQYINVYVFNRENKIEGWEKLIEIKYNKKNTIRT